MYFVYVIRSKERHYTYIGMTSNLERRLKEHNEGKNKTTKPYKPFFLVLSEQFETRTEAREREKYFKSGIGRDYIKRILTNS
jgi:putative endonuclease